MPMSSNFKPDQYSTVSPYLIAAGAQKVIAFLKKAFGASELRRFDLPDGSIMHAEVRIGDTVVMIGDAGPEWPAVPAHFTFTWKTSTQHLIGRFMLAGLRCSVLSGRVKTRIAEGA